ncbi:MAG TPA: signal recognition particle protein [Nitrospiria bacterium]|nr:signal recognition particle protein [Nitrospiria bacterium]
MLERLSEKLDGILKKLRGRGVLTEKEVSAALREVRMALLEADVHYSVVRDFVERVREKAIGQEVMQSLTPGQQVVKIVWDELRALMGATCCPIQLSSHPPTVLMMVGLQGVGKTTTAAKLGRLFKSEGRRVLLVAADTKRPAASEQLQILGRQLEVEVVGPREGQNPEEVCLQALEIAGHRGDEVVILDTAGRLHIDQALMDELVRIKEKVVPHEILLVADGMTGQSAVSMAEQFHRQLGLTGIILTKMEGDARGGALLSIYKVTGQPIKYLGVGEGLSALESFHPDRMASRILGMGDVLSLIERAQSTLSADSAVDLEDKIRNEGLSLEDLRHQLRQIRKLGSLADILEMIPGVSKFKQHLGQDAGAPEQEMKRVAAILDSMTLKERRHPQILNGSRRQRIARGSGTTVQEVNRLLKQFQQLKKMMKVMGNGGRRNPLKNLLFR